MHALLRLSSAIDRMNERIGKLVAWLGLAAVVVCTANAIARYAFNVASNAWLELQWYFNAAVFLLIAAYALRRNEHVRIDVINGRLSPRAQAWIDILGGLLMLLPGLHPGRRAKRSLVRPNDSHNGGVQPIGAAGLRPTRHGSSHQERQEARMQQLKDVMSRHVKMVSPDTTIREAAQQMRDGNFGMLPVAENDRMVGAISDRDIAIRAVADDKGPETTVRDVMTDGIFWAYEDESVEEAARIMSERQVRRLPIVNRDKRLVGIVALGDFAVHRADIQPAAEALSGISQH